MSLPSGGLLACSLIHLYTSTNKTLTEYRVSKQLQQQSPHLFSYKTTSCISGVMLKQILKPFRKRGKKNICFGKVGKTEVQTHVEIIS